MSGMSPDESDFNDMASLAGLYALDALDGDERARFEAYLATSVEAQEEVAGFRAAAAEMSQVSSAQPPAGLRERVLAEVATTRQDVPVVRLADRRSTRIRQVVVSIAAALALVVAGLGGYLLNDAGGGETSELASLLSRPDTQFTDLRVGDTENVGGRLVYSPAAGTAIIVSDTMAPLDSSETYEAWRIDANGASKAGTFRPDADGNVEAKVLASLDGALAVAITVEPAGGSDTPTEPILLTAELD